MKKIKTKNLNLYSNKAGRLKAGNYRAKFKTFKLCAMILNFLLCTFSFSASSEHLESSPEPISLLEAYLVQSPRDVNTSNESIQKPLSPPKAHLAQGPNDVNTSNETKEHSQSAQSNLLISKDPDTQPERLLWQTRIGAPKDQTDNDDKDELMRIIEQIRSVEFRPQHKTTESPIVVEPPQNTEPNDNEALSVEEIPEKPLEQVAPADLPEPDSPKTTSEQKYQSEQPYTLVTSQTLQMLREMSRNPEQLRKPLQLAELLFHSGCLKEATVCYRQALSRETGNEAGENQNIAWILFQIGNCLRNDDPSAAVEMYTKLIAEYPNSPWTDLAKVRRELINWYRQDKPRELITKNRF